MQGKNTGNPDGLPSILTWQKRKLTFENRGSDNFCHPKRREIWNNLKAKDAERLTPFKDDKFKEYKFVKFKAYAVRLHSA